MSGSGSLDDCRALIETSPDNRSAAAATSMQSYVVDDRQLEVSPDAATQRTDLEMSKQVPHSSSSINHPVDLFDYGNRTADEPENMQLPLQVFQRAEIPSSADSGDLSLALQMPPSLQPLVQEQPTAMSGAGNTAVELNGDDLTGDLGFGIDPCAFDEDVGLKLVGRSQRLTAGQIFDLFPCVHPFSLSYVPMFHESAGPFFEFHPNDAGLRDEPLDHAMSHSDFQQQHPKDSSKAVFPHINSDASQWLTTKPSIWNFDRVVINHFLDIFLRQVPPTLTSFLGFVIRESTSEEEVLAIAAVGGLYSMTSGSQIMAKAMYADVRRLLLTRVRTSSSFLL